MQLEKESCKQLYRLINAVLREACYDYSKSSNLAVVNMNGVPLLFDKEELKVLRKVSVELEKEIEND